MAPLESGQLGSDKRCEKCGLFYDDDSAGAECERLEADMLTIHDALEDIGLKGAINASSIIERIERVGSALAVVASLTGEEASDG